jgi:protein-tyrosine phosphatase
MRRVIFVCWGNICRSPMAERVAEQWAADAGLDQVAFASAATSTEEIGRPMDSRARQVLDRAGYRSGGHRARQITAADIRGAELVLGMEPIHLNLMRRRVPEAQNLALLTDFDPEHLGQPIDDPWYGGPADFAATLAAIEAAMPGLMTALIERRWG